MTAEKLTVTFTIGVSRVEIALDTAALPQPTHPNGYVSFTGVFDGGGGQIVDHLRQATDDPRIAYLCDAWDRLHLKDSTAEIETVLLHLRALNGEKIDPPNVDDFEDCEFSNADSIIDSRDVCRRIEYLRAYVEEHPTHTDARDELTILESIEQNAAGYAADWKYGEAMIRDSYFKEYAEQLAEDIGAIQEDAQWPNNHVDWNAAAKALQQDYTAVDFDGVTYWIR